jgi:hypothetical protein
MMPGAPESEGAEIDPPCFENGTPVSGGKTVSETIFWPDSYLARRLWPLGQLEVVGEGPFRFQGWGGPTFP